MRGAALGLFVVLAFKPFNPLRFAPVPGWSMSPAASSLSLPLLVFGSIAVQSSLDTDRDGVPDALDNCPSTFNPDQHDVDGDGLGLSCDTNLDPRIWLRSSPHRRPFPRPRRLAD